MKTLNSRCQKTKKHTQIKQRRSFDASKGTFGGLNREQKIEEQTCTTQIPIIRETNIHFDNSVFTTLSQKIQDKEYGLAPVTVIRDPIVEGL